MLTATVKRRRITNELFENVEHFRYLETTAINTNCIHEKFKSGLNAGNAY
jgi:hypothetical protein